MKKVNFVFDWLGPSGPTPNNHPPSITELINVSGHGSVTKRSDELVLELTRPPTYSYLKRLDLARTFSASHVPSNGFLYEYEHYWWHYEDFYSSFHVGGFLNWGAKPNDVWKKILDKKAYLLITLPLESWIEDHKLAKLENYINEQGLPLSQIIYVTCSPNGQACYENYCKRQNKEPGIRVEYIPFYLMSYRDMAQNRNVAYSKDLKAKTFLMFNRRWASHPQRVLFLAHLYKNQLLDNFYISFPKTEVDSGANFSGTLKHHANMLGRRFPDNFWYSENPDVESVDPVITESDLQAIENILPLELDLSNFKQDLMFTEFDTTEQFYKDSLVHIISETHFFTDIIHLTEKSYKPIFYKQPFIMLGAPGSLKALKDQGFKTFSSLWNESYDQETDHKKRFFMILDIIKKIAAMPIQEKQHIIEVASYIVEYNYNNLRAGNIPIIDNFVERYGCESE